MSTIIGLLLLAVLVGISYRILRGKRGCSGNCNQGRRPCNCPLKDQNNGIS